MLGAEKRYQKLEEVNDRRQLFTLGLEEGLD
jgi:hypothetical protein